MFSRAIARGASSRERALETVRRTARTAIRGTFADTRARMPQREMPQREMMLRETASLQGGGPRFGQVRRRGSLRRSSAPATVNLAGYCGGRTASPVAIGFTGTAPPAWRTSRRIFPGAPSSRRGCRTRCGARPPQPRPNPPSAPWRSGGR